MGASETPPARRDRLLRVSGALALVSLLLVLADYLHPFGPKLLLWLPSTAGAVVVFLAFLRTSRTASLPEPTRRFWRHLTYAVACVSVGTSVKTVNVLTAADPRGPQTGRVMLACCAAAVLFIVYALY